MISVVQTDEEEEGEEGEGEMAAKVSVAAGGSAIRVSSPAAERTRVGCGGVHGRDRGGGAGAAACVL